MNITVDELMGHAFVISVDDNRLSAFNERWMSYGLPVVRPFRGFKMRVGDYNEVSTHIGSPYVNCSFSHLALIKMAEALNWPYIFILEDDALPCNSILQRLPCVLSNIPDDLKILKLGYIDKRHVNGAQANDLVPLKTYGSHAYIAFNRYYIEYEQIFYNNDLTADHQLINGDPKKLTVYHPLFIQKNPCAGYQEMHIGLTDSIKSRIESIPGGADFNF